MAVGNPDYNALLSTTIENFRDEFADNLSQSFFFFYWLTTQGRKLSEDGGESILVQLMYGKNTTVRSYDGYEVIDNTPQEGMTSAKFPWKQVAGTVSISRKEERQNSGKQRIINLLQSKVDQLQISMRDELNRMLYADGTGNDSKDIFGLDLLVEDGTAGGWGTVAGIDRSDALNTWWRNRWTGAVGSFASGGVDAMRTLYNQCSRGNEHPDFGLTTQSVHEFFEKTQVANQRFVDEKVANSNFELLKFKGMVLGWDEQCPSGTMFMLNSKYISFVVDKETDLVTRPFIDSYDQDAKSSKMLLMGNLVISNAQRHGRLGGLTA